jgi:hypothetical protein
MGVGAPIAEAKPSKRVSKISVAEPAPSGQPATVQTRREKRVARHANRRIAAHSGRCLRPVRYASDRSAGLELAALLLGWFRVWPVAPKPPERLRHATAVAQDTRPLNRFRWSGFQTGGRGTGKNSDTLAAGC